MHTLLAEGNTTLNMIYSVNYYLDSHNANFFRTIDVILMPKQPF